MEKQYTNPVLSGFYPDPSICRVGEDYYLVNSSFAYYPGIPVFHSMDLVSWELIGHVMNRPAQLDLGGYGVSRGIFAPSIRYHDGIFYLTCTVVDGKGNFLVTTKDPAGPWSDPKWLPEINGIDPCLFFDAEKSYIIYNSLPPENRSLYNGHRTIRIHEFDLNKLQTKGPEKILVNGGSNITKKPCWIEGPRMLKKDGYYYLIAAEGGTGYDHSVVAFRSKTINGPFLAYENNPVLTQRNLDASTRFPITSTGHADLVETPNGWQAVFLGCRPYEGDYYNTGRETFLVPVTWKDDWPLLNYGYGKLQYHYPLPLKENGDTKNKMRYSGNFNYKDNFGDPGLNPDWMFLRTPKEKWWDLSREKGFLSLKLRPETCAEKTNPSFLARRQQHLKCDASVSLMFRAASENEKAGLAVFQNEDHFYYLCQSIKGNEQVVELYKSVLVPPDTSRMELLASARLPRTDRVQLRIESSCDLYSFYFGTEGEKWDLLKDNLDAKFLSTKTAGGFVGCTLGLYATSLGRSSETWANYDWFEYVGRDDAYISAE